MGSLYQPVYKSNQVAASLANKTDLKEDMCHIWFGNLEVKSLQYLYCDELANRLDF